MTDCLMRPLTILKSPVAGSAASAEPTCANPLAAAVKPAAPARTVRRLTEATLGSCEPSGLRAGMEWLLDKVACAACTTRWFLPYRAHENVASAVVLGSARRLRKAVLLQHLQLT